MKDVLLEWKKEVDKKPPEMSVSEAYETLGLEAGVGGHEESKVRKAYFKLAQKYHPDKNPEGRVRIILSFILLDYTYMYMYSNYYYYYYFFLLQSVFEAVNKAYEFLCSKSAHTKVGPDADRIVLLLRTQSILFTRSADSKLIT